nr:YlmH/Sll1252 family protein [Desulforamulus aquiferis]
MKLKRDLLIGHIREREERALLAKVLDRVEIVLTNHRPMLTNFHDPYHTGLIISVLERITDIEFATEGGFPIAERVRTVIFPDYMTLEEVDFEMSLLSITGNFKMNKVSHRDFLGAILSLGIKREMIGDLLVTGEGCQVLVANDVASYLRANLTKVQRVGVEVSQLEMDKLVLPEKAVKEIRSTVASLRLDAIAASGFSTSRSRIAREIQAEKLSLNWQTCSNVSAGIREGDMISMRGRGRVEVAEVKGNTRSGRISILLRRYL